MSGEWFWVLRSSSPSGFEHKRAWIRVHSGPNTPFYRPLFTPPITCLSLLPFTHLPFVIISLLPFLSYCVSLLLHLSPTASLSYCALTTPRATYLLMMGVSWQTPEQKAFIGQHLPSYIEHSVDGTLKNTFWPNFLEKWFGAWPIPEPTPELAEGGGNNQNAMKGERARKVAVSAVYSPTHQPRLTFCTATEARVQKRVGRCRRGRPTST